METKIAVFKGKRIRKTIHKNEWWFSVVDVIEALTDSVDPRDYWFKMKIRVKEEDGFQPSTICRQLKLPAPDGKMRETDCADTEGIFRIIQSVPSPKAEPFKRWLAKVGYERVQEWVILNLYLRCWEKERLRKFIVPKTQLACQSLNQTPNQGVRFPETQESN